MKPLVTLANEILVTTCSLPLFPPLCTYYFLMILYAPSVLYFLSCEILMPKTLRHFLHWNGNLMLHSVNFIQFMFMFIVFTSTLYSRILKFSWHRKLVKMTCGVIIFILIIIIMMIRMIIIVMMLLPVLLWLVSSLLITIFKLKFSCLQDWLNTKESFH